VKFSESEIRFLIQSHPIETATGRREVLLTPAVDLRTIGCPAHIFEAVLECRARKLGNKFVEFRSQQVSLAKIASSPTLAELEAERLF